MPPKLRFFQRDLERDIYAQWSAGAQNVMAVSPTGSGKTVVLSKILYDEPGSSIAIAHRRELVSQISMAIARNGVRHRIVGAKKGSILPRVITALHVYELGYSYLDPIAKTGVGGVDTVVKMTNEPWFNQVRLQVQDEGHHVLKQNKWGRCAKLFPNARGLFPTATPERADGNGLGRHADGLMDAMVLAPSMRDIINLGFLTDYRYIGATAKDLDLSKVQVSSATGDLNQDQNRQAVHASRFIVGDIVGHYIKWAHGKLDVIFAVDVEAAKEIAEAFRAQGIKAEVVTADTPPELRADILRRFAKRDIWVLVNVDLFGEGFDLPAIECVQFGRPTDSFAVFAQQWGRVLRLMLSKELNDAWDTFTVDQRLAYIAASDKPVGIVIDHVGNLQRHNGPPDKQRVWSLNRRERAIRNNSDTIPIRVCANPECLQAYEAFYKACPYCQFYPEPAERSSPVYVDGDLTELDAVALMKLRKEITRIDGDFFAPTGLSTGAQIAARRNHMERQINQTSLRNAIMWWAGVEAARGYNESASYRRFYFRFGIDVANAQALGSPEAKELTTKILTELSKYDIDGTVNASLYFANS